VGKGRRHWNYFNKCNRKVCSWTLDSVVVVGVLNAFASVISFEEGRCVHQQRVQSGLESDVFVGISLVDTYAKCGSMVDAWMISLLFVFC
jgi:hypothetical protein